MRTISTLGDLRGKRILVRSDFNVPLKDGVITDDGRIRAALPTLKTLTDAGAKVVILAHLGRPKGKVDPASDIETIKTELILADMQTLEKQIPRLEKEVRGKKTEAIVLETAREALELLEKGELLSGPAGAKLDQDALKSFQLMTSKPFIFVFNMDAEEMDNKELQDELRSLVAPAEAIFLDAQFESELVELDEDDAREMLAESGQSESGLDKLARVGFDTLGLQTYLTAGEKEARAWTIHKGDTAPKAAGVIHTDFEKGFIKAEVVSYDDLVEAGSMAAAKAAGKVRMAGKD